MDARTIARQLNEACFCAGPDREAFAQAAASATGADVLADRPNLVSPEAVFVSEGDRRAMLDVVAAVEAAARLPGYRDAALARAPQAARQDFGPAGAFMGYDFHVGDDGPRLIEVNTNAGGAFVAALVARSAGRCGICPVDAALGFEDAVVAMFEAEWALQRGGGRPGRIAIVDDRPAEQYLHPEFVLAQRLFRSRGIDAVIADAADLRFEGGRLLAEGAPADLVYNRLTDFGFEAPGHTALRDAYLAGAVVVTPGPRHHALYADKRNLVLLSDPQRLASWGLEPRHVQALAASCPPAAAVTAENAEALWARRGELYFKPAAGHGSKAVYRGEKLTRKVWAEIVQGGYIAQAYAPPAERHVRLDGGTATRKADVRLYAYRSEVLLAAARVYQGQTTNFRTPGGGFAPVVFLTDQVRAAA